MTGSDSVLGAMIAMMSFVVMLIAGYVCLRQRIGNGRNGHVLNERDNVDIRNGRQMVMAQE